MKANTVTIGAKSKLIARKGGSSISLEGDCYNNAGIVMENGSDRASNPNFTDDPQNGAAEAKEAEMQANVAALASASQGSQPALGNVSPDLRAPFNLDGRNPFMNGEMNTTLPKNESYITHDDGNSIPVDSIPVYSSANQYQPGQIIRQKGYDGKWYTGTAQEDGTIGTGGYHRYKFVPNNEEEYNENNSKYINKKRKDTLEFWDAMADGISKYTYCEQKSDDSKTLKLIDTDDFKLNVGVLSGKGWLGLKLNVLDDDGNYSPQFKIGTNLEGKLITFPYEFKPVKVANQESKVDGEINLMSFSGKLYFNSGNDDFENTINIAKAEGGILGSFAEAKNDFHNKTEGCDVGEKEEVTAQVGSLGGKIEIGDSSLGWDAADIYGVGYDTSIEKTDKDNK